MTARKRTLTDAELVHVWHGAGELGWPFGDVIRLLILLGQRRDETAGLARSETNQPKRQWLLPGERTKNGLPNLVHLSAPAWAIVAAALKKTNTDLLFTTTGETAISGFSNVKKRLDASILVRIQKEAREKGQSEEDVEKVVFAPWRYHDLRRTLATGCQRLGVDLQVTEAVLNHVSGSKSGIVGVYQTYQYEAETKAALEKWGRHVAAITKERPNALPEKTKDAA
jgi:integrase